MATSRPKITELRVLAAKLEPTTGVAVSLAAADGLFNIYNPKLVTNIEMNDRPSQGSFSPQTKVVGKQAATLDFEIEMAGNGSAGAPQWANTFLPAMGFYAGAGSNNTIFSPVSGPTSPQTLTIGLYEDGTLKTISGASGSFKLHLEDGAPGRIMAHFEGAYVGESSVANVAPSYPTLLPPVFQNVPVTIGAFTPLVSKIEIDVATKLYLRPSQGSATGYVSCAIVGRKITGTMDPESTDLATRNWYNKLVTNSTEALSIGLGSAANNTITIAGPAVQCTKKDQGDRGGVITDDVTLQFNRVAAAGDDEMTISFT